MRRRLISGGGSLPALTYIGKTRLSYSGQGATLDFGTPSIGVARSDRVIIAGLEMARGSGALSSPSLIIGGVSANQQIFQTIVDLQPSAVALFSLVVPAGTTAAIVATTPTAWGTGATTLSIWAVTGLISATATNTASDTTNPVSLSLPVSDYGVAVMIGAGSRSVNTSWSTTGISEDFDEALQPNNALGCSYTATTATTLSISATASLTVATGCAASFR